jgi:hypothetical protein
LVKDAEAVGGGKVAVRGHTSTNYSTFDVGRQHEDASTAKSIYQPLNVSQHSIAGPLIHIAPVYHPVEVAQVRYALTV